SIVQHQNPIAPLAPRWGDELTTTRVRELVRLSPRPVARVEPVRLHGFAAELIHVDTQRLAFGRINQSEAAVMGARGDDSKWPAPGTGGRHRLAGQELVPRPLLEESPHCTHLTGRRVVHRRAPVHESVRGERTVALLEDPEEIERAVRVARRTC